MATNIRIRLSWGIPAAPTPILQLALQLEEEKNADEGDGQHLDGHPYGEHESCYFWVREVLLLQAFQCNWETCQTRCCCYDCRDHLEHVEHEPVRVPPCDREHHQGHEDTLVGHQNKEDCHNIEPQLR